MSVATLKVIGTASQRETILKPTAQDLKLTLMNYLIQEGFTIASSCSGEGACKKCVVNEDLISCQITVGEVLRKYHEIKISYL